MEHGRLGLDEGLSEDEVHAENFFVKCCEFVVQEGAVGCDRVQMEIPKEYVIGCVVEFEGGGVGVGVGISYSKVFLLVLFPFNDPISFFVVFDLQEVTGLELLKKTSSMVLQPAPLFAVELVGEGAWERNLFGDPFGDDCRCFCLIFFF